MYAEIPLMNATNIIPNEYGITVSELQFTSSHFNFHWHDYYTIDIVLEGEGVQYINNRENTIRSGSVQLISPTDIHGIRTDTQLITLSVRFAGNILTPKYENIVYSNSSKAFYPTKEVFQHLVCYAKAILFQQQKKSPFAKEAILQNFQLILLILAELKNMKDFQNTEDKVERILKYLSEHFRENPSVKQMASMFEMSPSYFSTYFKKETGKTYVQYLTDLKIHYACLLLKTDRIPLIDICFSSGFTSYSRFNSVFREQMGCSPTSYRAKQKGCYDKVKMSI